MNIYFGNLFIFFIFSKISKILENFENFLELELNSQVLAKKKKGTIICNYSFLRLP